MAMNKEAAIQKAVDEANDACQAAYEKTPKEYWGYITLISQNKRVGGSRNDPWYARIQQPYIRVDGRVTMMEQEHQGTGETYSIHTEFVEAVPGTHVCRATVKCMRGTATGHAQIGTGDDNPVDRTNPLENAETSALGRALGFLGYGLLGTGIASAEEVYAALANYSEATQERPMPDMTSTTQVVDQGGAKEGTPGKPASDKQRGFLAALLNKLGVARDDAMPLISTVYGDISSYNASQEIEALKETDRLPRAWVNAYVKMLRERAWLSSQDVAAYLDRHFPGIRLPANLTGEDQKQLINWLVTVGEESTSWESVVARVAETTGHNLREVEDWILAQYGDGATQLYGLGGDVLATIRDMPSDQASNNIAQFITKTGEAQ